jgi:hypothetical protein
VAHHDGVPFAAVVGAREVAAGQVALRAGAARRTLALADAVAELAAACAPPMQEGVVPPCVPPSR